MLGIPWDEVHEEAERLEHAMSPVLEERMLAAIGDAKTCPHGHPIVEGAREQGVAARRRRAGRQRPRPALRERGRGAPPLPQARPACSPGLDGTLESSDDDEVVVASDDGEHAVSRSVAETVSVRADPAPPPRPPLPEQLVLSSDRYGR